MRKILPLAPALMLAACAITAHPVRQDTFDLGPVHANSPPALHPSILPPLVVAAPNVPSWLDSNAMLYRLNYADERQLHSYANNRWAAPPLQLFDQRLKMRLAESGGRVLTPTENAQNVTLTLRIDAEDFTQQFDRADHGVGRIALRVSLFDGRKLVAQTNFSEQEEAPSPDAAGGARALSHAADLAIADIIGWVAGMNLPANLPH